MVNFPFWPGKGFGVLFFSKSTITHKIMMASQHDLRQGCLSNHSNYMTASKLTKTIQKWNNCPTPQVIVNHTIYINNKILQEGSDQPSVCTFQFHIKNCFILVKYKIKSSKKPHSLLHLHLHLHLTLSVSLKYSIGCMNHFCCVHIFLNNFLLDL